MKNKTLFSFDIDGTLMDEKTLLIPPTVKEAVELIHKNGDHAIINTGRHWYTTKNISEETGITKSINLNGNGIFDFKNQKILWQNFMDGELRDELIDFNKVKNYGIIWYTDLGIFSWKSEKFSPVMTKIVEHLYLNGEGVPYRNFEEEDYSWIQFVEEMKSMGELVKVIFATPEQTEGDWSKTNEIEQYFFNISSTYKWTEDTIEINPIGSSKDSAIPVAKNLIFDDVDVTVVSFGDGPNDVPIFNNSDVSYCMRTAKEEISKLATHIVSGAGEDGILEGVKHYYENYNK